VLPLARLPAASKVETGTEVVLPYGPSWLPLASSHTQGLSSDCDLTALAATATGELAISGYMQLPGIGSWQQTVAFYNGSNWLPL
jgi:hypothetical protein